jgi:hypothetical protein
MSIVLGNAIRQPELNCRPRTPVAIRRRTVIWRLVALMAALTSGTLPAAAQTATATLIVEARDSEGALLPGVEVRLVNQATAVERVTTTTDAGTAIVALLPAGHYTATASLAGFKKDVVKDLRLEAGGKGNLDLVLVAGAFEESVIVSADAGRLRAEGGTLGESFEGRLLVMMPVENRDFHQFTYQ